MFVLSGWVGQDYFSPQGFTYLLYLAFVAILLVWFRATARALDEAAGPGEAEVEPDEPRPAGCRCCAWLMVGCSRRRWRPTSSPRS